ncbi:MAG: DUF916 domain-containing protein [bacterium]
MRLAKAGLIFSLALWLFGISNLPVSAAGLGVIPQALPNQPNRSWFVYTMSQGVTQEDAIVVNNHGEKPVTAVLEALDGTSTGSGGFTLVKDASFNQDLGKWIELQRTEVAVPAGGSVEVPFKVTVPSQAGPGEHSGGIVVSEKSVSSGGMQLKVRVGARMYITVPGPISRKITFQKVTHEFIDGKLHFKVQAKNASNVNLSPTVDIKLRGLIWGLGQSDKDNGTFLPNSTIMLDKTWNHSAPVLGWFRATITLHTLTTEQISEDGSKKSLPNLPFKYSYSFWVGGPLVALLAGIIILGWLIYRLFVYLLDRRKFATKTTVVTVGRNESIMHIAEKTGALPQSIIKFSRLKWPYALNPGDKLLVPNDRLTPDELYRKTQTEFMPAIWRYLISWQASLYHPAVHRKLSDKLIITKSRKQGARRRR